MTFIALFASTFSLVFLLGIQQLNVHHGYRLASVSTSLAIGCAQLALFKLAPDADAVQIAGFLSGGPVGIWCAMEAHPHLRKLFGSKP